MGLLASLNTLRIAAFAVSLRFTIYPSYLKKCSEDLPSKHTAFMLQSAKTPRILQLQALNYTVMLPYYKC